MFNLHPPLPTQHVDVGPRLKLATFMHPVAWAGYGITLTTVVFYASRQPGKISPHGLYGKISAAIT